jgi:light-regulated signal transduction histidine kinase (bacteriophytochrome)/ActR/RegA family two-component response regulator
MTINTMTKIDTTDCENEPIRFPGTVQPHGVLLVLEAGTGIIEAASESCTALLGLPAESLLGLHVSELFGPTTATMLVDARTEGLQQTVHLWRKGMQLAVRPRFNDAGQVLVDIEIEEKYSPALLEIFYNCRRDTEELRRLNDVVAIAREAANSIRRTTRFDRVMVYRFDADWNGEVIAESCVEHLEPLLGLHFPASDIPKQARELFQSCKVRLIADVMYTPSALIARQGCTPVDLGQTSLRSVSPIHIEYLRNMQVRASLVVALSVEERLWGLLVCHHSSGPKYLGPGERDAIGWFCEDIAALIGTTLNRQRRERQASLANRRRKLVDAVRADDFKGFMERGGSADLLEVVGADGFALIASGSVQTMGMTPTPARIERLALRQRERSADLTLFATSALSRDLDVDDDASDGLAGALFISLRDRPNVTMIWFRKERHYSVRWSGNPDHPHMVDDSGRISPRKSFAQFLKDVQGQSLEWTPEEVASAAELGALIEIEVQHRSQAELYDRLAQIATRVPGVIYQYRLRPDGSSCFPYASEALRHIYRVAPEVVREDAAPVFANLHPDDHDIVVASIQRSAATLEPWRQAYRVRFPDGTVRWLDGNALPHKEQDGSVLWHGFITDITAQKQAGLALEKANKLLHESIDSLAQGFTVYDENDRLVVCNEAYLSIYATSRDLIVTGASFEEIVRKGAERGQYREAMGRVDDWVAERVKRHQEADGSYLEQQLDDGRFLLIVEYRTPSGFTVGNRIDITERKAIEAELDQHRHHLEAMVEARTAALSIAKEAAETASRAKSIFLATMSHELRTPLNAVMGMTELALRRATDPKQIDHLNKINVASNNLLVIIKDILELSRIEADRVTLQYVDFRLVDVVQNLVNSFGQEAADKDLRLFIDIDSALAEQSLRGDALRLGQILLNLTGNAIKFTAQGSLTVRVVLVKDNPADALLRFEVQDTGIGIAAVDQLRIFDVFEQADGSTTRKHSGTGLGLAICRRLVQLMGGDIHINSKVGVGSTFWFVLRLAKTGQLADPAAEPAGRSARSQLKARHAGAYILIAEDDELNQEIAQGLLEETGLVAHVADDGAKAVEMAKRINYDLILMDIQMPRMDGYEATRQIRLSSNNPDVPIIALTANVFAEDKAACHAAGMNDFIGRPVESEAMFATMLKWLKPARD